MNKVMDVSLVLLVAAFSAKDTDYEFLKAPLDFMKVVNDDRDWDIVNLSEVDSDSSYQRSSFVSSITDSIWSFANDTMQALNYAGGIMGASYQASSEYLRDVASSGAQALYDLGSFGVHASLATYHGIMSGGYLAYGMATSVFNLTVESAYIAYHTASALSDLTVGGLHLGYATGHAVASSIIGDDVDANIQVDAMWFALQTASENFSSSMRHSFHVGEHLYEVGAIILTAVTYVFSHSGGELYRAGSEVLEQISAFADLCTDTTDAFYSLGLAGCEAIYAGIEAS